MEHRDEVRAVIDDEIGIHVEDGVEIAVVFFLRLPLLRIDVEPVLVAERLSDGIVGREGVAAGETDVRSRIGKRDGEHSGLGLGMKGHSDLETGQGLFLDEVLSDLLKNGHMGLDPMQFQ